MRVSILAVAVVLLSRASGFAQGAEITTSAPPRIEERVDVVGVTPIHGIGLAESKVPANVQVFTADQLTTSLALDVPTLLTERAASVQVSDAQAGTFQPDLLFRGFVGSPLLGASEGLAVYQDGVRLNDPFGDTVPWDMLPSAAIASINVIPGSNPLFGLNALGGALSIRTKDGFGFPGQRVSFATGSFARHRLEVESGAHGRSFGYYVAGALTDESGWRDFSPSTIRRVFGDVAWRGTASALNLSLTAASNDLTGNGAAPVDLLDDDRDAVFTHPDRTDNDIALLTAKARRQSSDRLLLEAVAYYRHARTETFNGDAADGDDHEGEAGDLDDHEFGGVNNISDTRGRGVGVTGQMTRTGPLWGRDNHFIAGAGADAAATHFEFATELAHLTPERGTIGSGLFDEDAAVDLESRVITGSTFATNTWSVTSAVSITGSARFNWTALRLRDQLGTALTGDHRFGRVNPAAGITYQARPWLNIYGSYTQSSRVPTPVELTCADPDDPCRLPNAFVSDPPLDQIVAATWEAGLRGAPGSIDWTLAGFTTAATDDIIFISSGTLRGEGHFENVATTERRGIEASVGYDVANRLSVFAAYTFQHATFGTDLRIASRFHPDADAAEISVAAGSRMPGVPAHTAKSGVTAALTERLNVGVNLRMQSGQFLRGDEGNLLAPLPGFTLVHAHARHRVTSRVTAVVQAQNIFGAAFYTFGVLGDAESLLGDDFDDPRFYSPGAPRAAWVGIEVRF
jgi:outer membrane receptor protein involved in Fe transport